MTFPKNYFSTKVFYSFYLALSRGEDRALAQVAMRLVRMRAAIAAPGTGESDMAMYDRLYQMAKLHVPNIDEALALSEKEHAQVDHFVTERRNRVRAIEALDIPGPAETAHPALRVAVSGIGRSGTTLIYQQLAKLMLLDSRTVNFRYEPYLWNIQAPQAKGNPFDMSQLHQFGLMVHTTAPLFLDGPDSVHDSFIDHLYNENWDRDPTAHPDTYLTKVIRGSGRLRSYLKRYPDMKIVACLRNPVDTINSSLGMFSFFGQEFHADDRHRFREELEFRGVDTTKLDAPELSIEWYAAWWRAFTEETLAVAADYPDNVFLFCYEAFQNDSQKALEDLMNFVGVRNTGMFMGLSQPAGPTIKATSLTQHDIHALGPNITYYNDAVLFPRLGKDAAKERMDKVVTRYLGGRFSFPIAGSDLGRRCPIQLRGMMLNGAKSPFMSLAQRPAHPISLPAMIEEHSKGGGEALRQPASEAGAGKHGKTFGVIITCYNNAATIADALLSCLNQTLPFDEIVVVNDKSTDKSADLLGELAKRYSSVQVLNLPSNLGPSAARHLGIRKLTTDFFTQLDGDDLYWPTKNAQEAAAVAGNEANVAFSDILLALPGKSLMQSTAAYDGKSGAEAWKTLLARTLQIPRDMTLSRKLYFDAGGYDMNMKLYEDWEFKLRLATKSGQWIRTNGYAGTVYNRLSPSLSGVDDSLHGRALSQIFLRSLAYAPEKRAELLPAFDATVGRFKARHVSLRSRAALETLLTKGDSDLGALAAFVARRDMFANPNTAYCEALDAFVAQSVKTEIKA